MDHFNAAAVDRTVVLFLMPESGKVTGSVPMSITQALSLAEKLRAAAILASRTPMTGPDAVAECTGVEDPEQLRFGGIL